MQFFNARLRASMAAATLSMALLSPIAMADLDSLSEGKPIQTEELNELQAHLKKKAKELREVTVGLRIGGGSGSGVIISEDGLVLTAAHVSRQPGQPIMIILNDGKTVRGTTLGAYFGMDASLVKIDEEGPWPYAEMGTSKDLKPGQWVVAMGHPGGFQPDRPAPLRLGRVIGNAANGVTTDCLLINGDSGGPLFDLDGNVIGINSRISGNPKANIHVPIDAYTKDWERMVKGETWGMRNNNTPNANTPYIGLRPTQDQNMFKVAEVVPNSPAEKAGLQAGDIVTKFNDKPINGFRDLVAIVRRLGPGKKVKMQVMRDEKLMTVDVTIGRFGDRAQSTTPSTPEPKKNAEADKSQEKKPATKQTKKDNKKEDKKTMSDKILTDKEKKALERKKNREAKAKAEAQKKAKAEAEARRKRMLEQQKLQEQARVLQMDQLQKNIRSMKVSKIEKNHESVLDAFTSLVDDANDGTVIVYAGRKQIAMGTVVHSNGYILTKASELREGLNVKFPSGPRMQAKLIGVVEELDLAMLRVPAIELHTVEWSKADAKLGTIIASADSMDAPMSFGVVSVEPRKLHARGFIGISFQPGSNDAIIGQVNRKNMKDKVTLKTGDLITHVDGMASANASAVIEMLSSKRPNDKVTLTIEREGKTLKGEYKLITRQTMMQMMNNRNANAQQDRRSQAIARSEMLGGELNDRRSDFTQVFQHDTFLFPEQVGGPVVGLDGKVLGINIARAGRIKSYALPVSVIAPKLKGMMEGKHSPSDEFMANMKKKSVMDNIEATRLELYRANFEKIAAERKARQAEARIKQLEKQLNK